ncbi:MAG: tRNA (adenosine(37)-N6)-dimethylallyltransferase MiaA [Candidatus Eremiobacteraeota bacterium]|nr:tRNA (adenosine(37)-N6)-dimethylallyltransferase MiaA [Candidatus Eremiobacteraeota bacterium]
MSARPSDGRASRTRSDRPALRKNLSSVLILAGPTASGKTALALALAERFGAEIVGADSRQIYRGMPIGTAAPDAAQLAAVRHHLIGFLDPHERYSASAFVDDALAIVERSSLPIIVVGGTGFYLRALAGDVALGGARDEALRARLAREAQLHPPDVLHAWLAARDPRRASAIEPADRYRVVRALEAALGGERHTERRNLRTAGIPFVKTYLEIPQVELEQRIRARVDRMLEAGLVEEAERVGADAIAADAVGYPQALAYARGFSTRGELREQLYRATRRYAKRQATWFRTEPELVRISRYDDVEQLARTLPGW